MSRLVRKAGLPAGFTFHGLRHSHASILLKGGAAGLRDVAARLGHASAAFTVATYGHTLPGQDASIAATFDAALKNAGIDG